MNELNLLNNISNRGCIAIIGDDGNPVMLPSPGDYIGRFRILEELGTGGVGVVYKAADPETEVVRAIKIPFPKSSRRDLDRFKLEAKIGANLEHPNVVRVYKIEYLKGVLPYIEMDYISGKNLKEYIGKKPIPVPVGLGIIALICQALEYIHSRTFIIDGQTHEKLIHRDIKPSNILITDKGIVKVVDFGLAKFEKVEMENTIVGTLPGTLPYMAPEQHLKSVATTKTDVYSLGVTLYETITGKRPFPEANEDFCAQMIAAKSKGKYLPPSQIIQGVTPRVDVIVKRCLAPEHSDRYSTYAPLRMAIKTALDEYAKLPPDTIVKMYFSNYSGYKLAIPEKTGRGKGGSKPVIIGIAAIIILLSIIFGILKYAENKQNVNGKQLQNSVKRDTLNTIKTVNSESNLPANSSEQKFSDSMQVNIEKTQSNLHKEQQLSALIAKKENNIDSPIKAGAEKFKAGDFNAALQRLTHIEIDNLKSVQRDSVVLLILESYYRTNAFNEGLVYGAEHTINDSKYYLLMGLFYDIAAMKDLAEASFTKALTAPLKYDSDIRPKAYLHRARFYQRMFETDRTNMSREKMISAWRDFINNGCIRQSKECDDAMRLVGSN
jgi:serine/threonine protein kinase